MITKAQYLAIDNWLKEKSLQNFKVLFVLGFNLKGYYDIYELSIDKLK